LLLLSLLGHLALDRQESGRSSGQIGGSDGRIGERRIRFVVRGAVDG